MANHVGRVEESKCYHYLITLSPITWDIIKIVSVTLPPYGVHVTKTRTREDWWFLINENLNWKLRSKPAYKVEYGNKIESKTDLW